MSRRLIEDLFIAEFDNPWLAQLHDGAVFDSSADGRLAFTTDGYVVSPPIFPGGDIGSLAVNGTVNDLAMCGAIPLHLAVAFILEEGLSMETLRRVVRSAREAADRAGVSIVTGDTKVVGRGAADGLYITTSGVGVVPAGIDIAPSRATPGDAVVVSGAIGVHGIAVMSAREGFDLESAPESDTAPLNHVVAALLSAVGPAVHVLRDPTRGGLAATLNELAMSAGVGIEIDEESIPVTSQVTAACELLGLDPLHLANEGKFVAILAPDSVDASIAVMHRHPVASDATVIGKVSRDHPGTVVMRTRVGGRRIVDLPLGELVPRIC